MVIHEHSQRRNTKKLISEEQTALIHENWKRKHDQYFSFFVNCHSHFFIIEPHL